MAEMVLDFNSGKLLEANIKRSKLKLVDSWIEIHKDELMADWELAINGKRFLKFPPLK
ncbi:MAG: DUF4160 domain-containing protein [Cocleimonas sp.]